MNRKFFTTTLIALLALLLIVGGVTAQDPEPEGESKLPGTHSGSDAGNVSIAATVNSRISYQGVLKEDGSPVTGTRNMVFQFYTQDDCSGTPVESVTKNGVQVADGLFDVELDVTHSDFNGQGLWLAVEVGGTAIGCREIMPVPYALSLRPGATIAGSDGFSTFTVQNSSSTAGSRAIRGYASAATGTTVGVNGRTESSTGGAKGVFGYAGAASGQTHGVAGHSLSTSGRGVFGHASAITGTTYGVYGRTDSSSDGATGVYGYASADSGYPYGVYGESESGYGGYFAGEHAGVYSEGWLLGGVVGKSTGFGAGVKGEGTLGAYGVWAVNEGGNVALYVEGSGGADYIAYIDGDTRVTGDLVVNGYLDLPTISGSGPPTEDCNETSERGRMIMRIDTGTLYICANSGWVSK
jgi:hypothetical protein